MPYRAGRKWCPTLGKIRHFNEAWAEIAAAEQTERFGVRFITYKCSCGWWHTADRTKKRAKDNAREPRRNRRRRSKRGEPPLFAAAALAREEERRREKQDRKRAKQRQRRRQKASALFVWEDDGGAYFPREDT
jgi:hypothetical protein